MKRGSFLPVIFGIISFPLLEACTVKPSGEEILDKIHEEMLSQNQHYYSVTFTDTRVKNQAIYGLVHLKSNGVSGISKAWFGSEPEKLGNSLFLLFDEGHWVQQVNSSFYTDEQADLITDSLHSPILINPHYILLKQKENTFLSIDQSSDVWKITWEDKSEAEQLSIDWNDRYKHITAIRYTYFTGTDYSYSRQWRFDYMEKADYLLAEVKCKQVQALHNQNTL